MRSLRGVESATWRAFGIYFALWLPALLLTTLVSVVGFSVFRSAPMLSAVSYLLALPALLIALKSFKGSAAALAVLMLWDIITTTWPHISLYGLFSSIIDVSLLGSTFIAIVVALISPFGSLIAFAKSAKS